MPLKEFSRYLEGKNFDEILHKGKKESHKLMLAQGVAPVNPEKYLSRLISPNYEQKDPKNIPDVPPELRQKVL